jgi:hypothetical protein
MANFETEKARSIRLPESLWDALDADAARCRRSSQKHLEALLLTFYEMENVEISKDKLELIGELSPTSKKKLPIANATVSIKDKKKRA